MSALVVDTHAALWYLTNSDRLSATALLAIDGAIQSGHPVYLPVISLVEVIYLVEKGSRPLWTASMRLSVRYVPGDSLPDMPDRIIAATALALGLPLVTRDRKIRAADLETIW